MSLKDAYKALKTEKVTPGGDPDRPMAPLEDKVGPSTLKPKEKMRPMKRIDPDKKQETAV